MTGFIHVNTGAKPALGPNCMIHIWHHTVQTQSGLTIYGIIQLPVHVNINNSSTPTVNFIKP